MNLKEIIRVIPDFPQPGIRFKDITTLLKNGPAYQSMINQLVDIYKDKKIDLVVGPEARGFVIAAPLAYALGVGFVPVRKPNKLPHETIEVTYDLEYGQDSLVMHKDAILPGQRVLIADDLLATGGTIAATLELVKQLGADVVGAAFLIELTYLDGREKLGDIDIQTLVQY
ncbi:adenine phosphoribosyltransferase [Shimazuella sp. AN120528]|uniref:adenine phosphoribosyltransferase n=1 Tax=Shimazuella soli TaxID=1892854 RepID=UPI001F0DB2C5|nr:adenine phosphoribosyltransferase [Shimazuella soli]MCH5584135.1 adenine phosphoribosyltransferase [Shimazuella soli]